MVTKFSMHDTVLAIDKSFMQFCYVTSFLHIYDIEHGLNLLMIKYCCSCKIDNQSIHANTTNLEHSINCITMGHGYS